jgi:putative proton-coupled thiamine transporter YuaJ
MLFNDVPFSEMSVFDRASTVSLYVTLGFILTIGLIAFFLKRKKPELLRAYFNTAIGLVIGYALGITTVLLYLKLDEYKSAGYVDNATFIPVLILLISAVALSLTGLIISVFFRNKMKTFSKFAAIVLAVGALAVLITAGVGSGDVGLSVNARIQLYVFTALIVASIVLIAFLLGKKQEVNSTKSIVYASISIAMAFALSYLTVIRLPSGGSITVASLLPIIVYSYMFGARKGVLVGLIYSLLQFIQAPWFLHPVQFLLDYPVAFSAIGLAGVFKERNAFSGKPIWQFIAGCILGAILRYAAHLVSGIFVFGSGDPENYSAVAWSFMYNAFVFADIAVVLIAGAPMFSSKNFLAQIDPERIK